MAKILLCFSSKIELMIGLHSIGVICQDTGEGDRRFLRRRMITHEAKNFSASILAP